MFILFYPDNTDQRSFFSIHLKHQVVSCLIFKNNTMTTYIYNTIFYMTTSIEIKKEENI